MNKAGLTLATLAAVGALAACVPPKTSTVIYRRIDATFTVADCNAYPGGGVIGQGSTAVCKIVP